MDELQSVFVGAQKSKSTPGPDREPPSYVIGIQLSVGQLKTLKLFFDAMPINSGMAFVIIQQSAVAAQITGKMLARLEMPIYCAAGDMTLERNSVYLIPPHQEMILSGGRLVLSGDGPDREWTDCGDNFFCSLAQDARERAIAVVLSDTVRDRTQGALAIGSAGGLVIVSDTSAKTDRLSNSPAEASTLELHVPPSRIAETLLKYAHRWSEPSGTDQLPNDLPSFTAVARERSKPRPSKRVLPAVNVQLARVLDAATQLSIIATEVDGTITVFNSGAENMLGYKSSEVVHKQTPEIFHLETEVEQRGKELSRELGRKIAGFEVFVAYANGGKFERRDWTYVRKDGRSLTVSLVVTAVRDTSGEITGFLGIAEDISERKLSEEALRKSEERFELAVAGSNDGIWDWDVLTNDVFYSARFKELLGYGEAEYKNVLASFENSVHPDDLEQTFAKVRRHLEHHEPYDVEYRLRTKGGEYRWFQARGQAVWDSTGRAVRMAGSITDLTKRKLTEAALEQYAAEIQRANETLLAAEREARKAVVERDQFLAMLSHELRNPLSALLNAVVVIEHVEVDPARIAKAQQSIRRQVHHMSRLLDDLLDVARITQGKIDFRKEVLDLNDLISEAVQVIQPAIEARRQYLSVIPAREPVMVEGDPTRLLQIVENLLTNASKYTPSEGAIVVELKKEAHGCELCVRDNGRGIDPEMLDEIFDIFFQSNNAIDRSDGGMGVGLTLVRSLVQMHAGTVTAHSDGLGHGSQFVIRLPLTSKPPTKSREPSAVTPNAVNRVLLIEDNPDSRDMLQAYLKLDGFRVEVAEDGEKGLEAIFAQRPDIALIDIGLPGLDGYEVARRVRKKLSSSEVYLVALTGYGQAKDCEAAFRAGFDEYLVKPVNPEDVTRVLRTPRKHS